MLIRSQNGQILLNIGLTSFIGIIKGCQVRAFIPGRETGVFLGEYSSEGRAIEVMEQIESNYIAYANRGNHYTPECAVFQMPAE